MVAGGLRGKHAARSSGRTSDLSDRVEAAKRSALDDDLDERLLPDLIQACGAQSSLHDQLRCLDLLSALLTAFSSRVKKRPHASEGLSECILSNRQALCSLLHQLWENFTSARSTLREVHQKGLTLLAAVTPAHEHQAYIRSRVEELLAEEGQLNKTSFAELEIVVKLQGTAAIRHAQPDFAARQLASLRDPTLASTVGGLISELLAGELASQTEDVDAADLWLQRWQALVKQVLLGTDDDFAGNMLLYLLPDLFRRSKQAYRAFCLDFRQGCRREVAADTARLLQCLHIGKTAHLIDESDTVFLHDLGVATAEQLTPLLLHQSDRVRVEALQFVLHDPRVTRPISNLTFDVLELCLDGLLEEAEPEARKDILITTRGFLFRLNASTHTAAHTLAKASTSADARQASQAYLARAQSFADQLVRYLRCSIEPGAGYQRTYLGLYIMMLCSLVGWRAPGPVLQCDAKLSSILPSQKLVRDIRPLPLVVNLFDSETYRLLLDRLSDPFTDNRHMAVALLRTFSQSPTVDSRMQNNAHRLLYAARARDADGGARAVQFLCTSGLPKSGDADLAVCEELRELQQSICTDALEAQSDLLRVARARPLHGRLAALSYIMQAHRWGSATDNVLLPLLRDIVAMAECLWPAVKDILCDDSPEGTHPVLLSDPSTAIRDADTQVVLSFCWRALRECADLLSAVIAKGFGSGAARLMSAGDFLRIGSLLQTWLVYVRHRGAFTAVEQIFVALCRQLLICSDSEELRSMPRQWLDVNIDGLSDRTKTKDLTRRSAGLPMSILAILVAEASVRGSEHFLLNEAVGRLHILAATPVEPGPDTDDLPQVHAMNTLKDIFREAKLSHACEVHIERAFFLAMDTFYSESWALRNCALMLYNAVLQRSFGSYFSREHSETHTMSTRMFFLRYPALADRVQSELETSVQALLREESPNVTTALHPLLTMLARLDLPKEGMDNDVYWSRRANLARLIESCAASQIWLVRSMAAKALPTVVEPGDVASFVITVLNQASTTQQNALHGSLMQIDSLLAYSSTSMHVSDLMPILLEVAKALLGRFVDLAGDNTCCITHALFLSIISQHFLHIDVDDKNVHRLQKMTIDHAMRWVSFHAVQDPQHITAGREDLAAVTTLLVLMALRSSRIRTTLESAPFTFLLRLVEHEDETVRLTVYNELLNDNALRGMAKAETILTAIEKRTANETWPLLQLTSRRALALLPATQLSTEASAQTREKLIATYFSSLEGQRGNVALSACTLQLLARLLGSQQTAAGSQDLGRFVGLVDELADANQSVEMRRAALTCITNCTSVLQAATATAAARLYITLLILLVDDDVQIREETALYVSTRLLETTPLTPRYARAALFTKIGKSDAAAAVQLRPALLELVATCETTTLADGMRSRLHPGDVLFETEKANLWRNEVQDCEQALQALDTLGHDDNSIRSLTQIAADALKAVSVALGTTQPDGPLGWSSIPDVWLLLRRCLLILSFAKEHGIDVDSAMLAEAARSEGLHPTLARLLAAV